MEPPRVNEVINLINLLNLRKSVGHDNISPYFLRGASNILAPALCYFIEIFSFWYIPEELQNC